jgi:hypothetical protein
VATTPYLDRQLPLPRPAGPLSGLAWVLGPWYVAMALFLVLLALRRPPALHRWVASRVEWLAGMDWTAGRVAGVVASAVLAYYLMIAVHEVGHVVAGWLVGFRFKSLRVGPLVLHRGGRLSLHGGPGALTNGVSEMEPGRKDRLSRRFTVLVAGGPAANLLSCAPVLLLPGAVSVFGAWFVLMSVTNAINDALPFESRLGVSDGRRILTMLLREGAGERCLALLELGQELGRGVLPEQLAPETVAQAVALVDDSNDTVTAHAIAYAVAFHQHRDDEAARCLDICLAHARRASPPMRAALISDAAVFQGRRRRNADRAGQWAADLPASAVPWLRLRAEAAVLEANGDRAGALGRLGQVESMLRALPAGAQRDVPLVLLARWQSEV